MKGTFGTLSGNIWGASRPLSGDMKRDIEGPLSGNMKGNMEGEHEREHEGNIEEEHGKGTWKENMEGNM
jgi:hypothetical protein